jgi:murein DD-endopeptidase MepM/ murein hydrolase activator NlpD
MHAIDFRCPIGTPLLAAGDGKVIHVKDGNTLTGIAVSNLFCWNSILLQLDGDPDDPLFVEYVHIQSSSVQEGDRVTAGQVIGTSGSVGFSPEPHLHFAAYRSSDATAATVQVLFRGANGLYLPQAGCYYDANGPR